MTEGMKGLTHEAMPGVSEARITISGVELNFAQSMTLRVALGAFAIGLEEYLPGDKLGANYRARLRELNEFIGRTAR